MTDTFQPNRRALLKFAAGAVAAVGLTKLQTVQASPGTLEISRRSVESRSLRIKPDEFRRQLEGPILSNPTPFKANYEVDYQALKMIIQRALHYGIKIFALTAGNSQYQALSYDEIKEITRVMVEAVNGRGLTIAATGDWWTGRAVDYARYAESVGADAVQILMPSRAGSEDDIVKHFESIAKSTRLAMVLHGVYSESLLKKLLTIESIVAMKEDAELTYFIDRQIAFGNRIAIFGGGQEYRFLVGHPYGARAFYSTYSTFAPDISMRFWKTIRSGNMDEAVKITMKYDYPYLKEFSHPWWHATLEYFGLAERYLRPPQPSFTTEQMNSVKLFFDKQGVFPSAYKA